MIDERLSENFNETVWTNWITRMLAEIETGDICFFVIITADFHFVWLSD